MITTLTAPRTKRRASVRSADGAAWRIKPEIRTLFTLTLAQLFDDAEWNAYRRLTERNLSNPFRSI